MNGSFGDPLTEPQMEACAVLVMRTMLQDFADDTGCPFDMLLAKFARSRTYVTLFDFDTRLWAEGPDYLRAMWKREIEDHVEEADSLCP